MTDQLDDDTIPRFATPVRRLAHIGAAVGCYAPGPAAGYDAITTELGALIAAP